MSVTADHRIALCRVVGVLLVTDGQLTDEEYEFFGSLLDRMEVPSDRRAEVTGAISIDTDISGDVAMLKEAGLAEQLLDELRSAANVDGDESKLERSIVDEVAEALAD